MRLLVLVALLVSRAAFAQDYPARAVTVIIPFSAGSASDVIARIAQVADGGLQSFAVERFGAEETFVDGLL